MQNVRRKRKPFTNRHMTVCFKAVSTEMFPICGMDQGTVDYLLATMSIHYKKYDVASKLLAGILASNTAGRQMKDKALNLKEEVVAELKKGRG